MELIEQIDAEYDKADALSGRCDIPRDTLLGWKNEVVQLKAKLEDEEGLKMQAVQEWNRVEAENEALKKFEGNDPIPILRLCAKTLENSKKWSKEIRLSRANWLRRFATHLRTMLK